MEGKGFQLSLECENAQEDVFINFPKRRKKIKKLLMVLFLAVSLFLYGTLGFAKETAKGKSGDELFQQHCSACHPDGGNNINPQQTLHKKDLDANKIKKPGDIINKMRHQGTGMTQFDKKTISDKDAKKIAEYVLKTFK